MPLKWEDVDDYHKRTRTPLGWLVKTYEDIHENVFDRGLESGFNWRVSMCHVLDPLHLWKIPKE